MALASLEVERKFLFNPETEAKLRGMGADLKGEQRFCDRYFDTEDFQLTLADHWLRSREGYWELKCPPEKAGRSAGPATRYLEVTQAEDIVCRLGKLLNLEKIGGTSVEDLVRGAKLGEFACYVTERKSYAFPGGIHIDLDRADFGYEVGEIEIMVGDDRKEENALEEINNLAGKLGLTNTERIPGKMSTFLMHFRPLHYQKLLEAHVL